MSLFSLEKKEDLCLIPFSGVLLDLLIDLGF